ncbi:hypothetical protein Tco_0667737 [Tanacetum coccineum]
MSNSNTNLQTQSSNALHNAIMEAGSKDRPPMLAPGNYVQWKSRIKRYIDTKPNSELIHYCLQNPPYTYQWAEKTVLVAEGSSETTTERYMENYKNVSQDIRDQLNAEAEAVQIILIGIDNDIYSTVDACPNACEMWKAIERRNKRIKSFLTSITTRMAKLPTYDPEPATKIYKPTNNNLRTSSNTSRANQDNSPRINRGTGDFVFTTARNTGMYQRECQKPKRVKDAAYHKEKMLLCKQEEAGCSRIAEHSRLEGYTDDDSEEHELEAHYMYMAQLQEVTPDSVDNSGPIFDDEPMHKVQNNNDNYNVFAMENEHPEQPESSNDIYLTEQGDSNIRPHPPSLLIHWIYVMIEPHKNRNKFLESSNKELVDKLKGEIEDFKTKNKSLESSNNHFKEANNELSKNNQLMFKDLKKFQAELDKYNDVNYASKVEIDCAKAKGDLMSYKIDFEKSSNAYTQKINDLNQTISDMKKELCAHQETISIMSQAKEAQIKLYKTREDKELDKVIALENKVKVWISKNYKKTVKIEQTRTRESEEFKKKPKIQSRSHKDQSCKSRKCPQLDQTATIDAWMIEEMIGQD